MKKIQLPWLLHKLTIGVTTQEKCQHWEGFFQLDIFYARYQLTTMAIIQKILSKSDQLVSFHCVIYVLPPIAAILKFELVF